MGGVFYLGRWDGLRCRDIRAKFNKYWFRHSKVNRVDIQTHTETSKWSHKPTYFFQNKKKKRLKGKERHKKGKNKFPMQPNLENQTLDSHIHVCVYQKSQRWSCYHLNNAMKECRDHAQSAVVRRGTGQKSCSGRGGPACNSLFPTSSTFHAPVWRQADEPGILATRMILHQFRRTGYKLHCQRVINFFIVSSVWVWNYTSRCSGYNCSFVCGKYRFDSRNENYYPDWDCSGVSQFLNVLISITPVCQHYTLFSSIVNVEATGSSETSVTIYRTTWLRIGGTR
jgi:hypothetical protein